jgi:hypothetical protein
MIIPPLPGSRAYTRVLDQRGQLERPTSKAFFPGSSVEQDEIERLIDRAAAGNRTACGQLNPMTPVTPCPRAAS